MRNVIIIAFVLFIIDAFVMNQGAIALITFVIVLPVLGIKAFINRKNRSLLKKRLATGGILFVMVVLVFTAIALNNKIARYRAKKIIQACENYKNKFHRYPGKLPEIVPEFMETIPLAKYTLTSNRFGYIAAKDNHLLYYIAIPPFGRATYRFENQQWGLID